MVLTVWTIPSTCDDFDVAFRAFIAGVFGAAGYYFITLPAEDARQARRQPTAHEIAYRKSLEKTRMHEASIAEQKTEQVKSDNKIKKLELELKLEHDRKDRDALFLTKKDYYQSQLALCEQLNPEDPQQCAPWRMLLEETNIVPSVQTK